MKIKLILVLLLVLTAGAASAQTKGKVYGLAFGDYFYKASGDSSGSSLEYSGYAKDFNTFEFRRVYLGYQHPITENITADVLLAFEGRELNNQQTRTVLVKTAEMKWSGIFEGSDLVVGLTATPGFSFITEKVWGYRAIEKTIMDQRGILGSRDLGVMLRGAFDKDKNYGYSFMIGNGRGARLENNKYKKFYGQLFTYQMKKKLVFEAYSDYEPVTSDRSRTTLKGFLGYVTDNITVGVEGFQQMQKNFAGDTADVIPFGISGFITGGIVKKKLNFYARYDYFDPDTENSTSGFKENFITVGLDFMPRENVHIMPNVWVNSYSDKSTAGLERDADVVPRISFWYVY